MDIHFLLSFSAVFFLLPTILPPEAETLLGQVYFFCLNFSVFFCFPPLIRRRAASLPASLNWSCCSTYVRDAGTSTERQQWLMCRPPPHYPYTPISVSFSPSFSHRLCQGCTPGPAFPSYTKDKHVHVCASLCLSVCQDTHRHTPP